MSPSIALEAHVRRRADKLDRRFERLVSCHVVVDATHRRHRFGKRYRVSIDMRVPHGDIAVARNPNDERAHEDAHAAIDDAFDDAERRLQDYAVQLKRHAEPPVHRQGER